jgi:hypothetical protein
MMSTNGLYPARQRFLISCLLAVDTVTGYGKTTGPKPSGVLRCNASMRWAMLSFLAAKGLIKYDYAPIYTTRETVDVTLTRVGHRIAARCLLWQYRQDLEAFPTTLWVGAIKNPQTSCLQ